MSEQPSTPDDLYAAAVAAWGEGRRDEAIARLDEALRSRPDFADALCMGGYILGESGKAETGLRFYERALALDPGLAVAHANSGKTLFALRRYPQALAAFDAALALRPADADAWNNRAGALRELGRLAESVAAASEALRRKPDFAEAALNLGNALLKLGRAQEALTAYRRARSAKADFAPASCGEALALRALGRFDEAMAAFERAEALGSREAIAGKGCLLLTLGDFERGWAGYEARWVAGKSIADALGARYARWRGPGREGERVLVLNDHGLGDTIQFCRYLPLMAEAAIATTFVCPPAMHRLLSCLDVARFVAAPPDGESFDAQIALSSLPFAFGTRLGTIPSRTPYLRPEAALVDKWTARLGGAGFRVGLVWQGNPHPEADMARSLPLAAFAPLAAIEGVRLISLQKGFGEEQLASAPPRLRIETLGPDFDAGLDAFVDAAGAMASLDLVITCDTSIAHLAGALGRPVWVALKREAEWRCLRQRLDSPWYPTMRLFRQSRSGDWAGVVAAMTAALTPLARQRSKLRVPPGGADARRANRRNRQRRLATG